MGNKVVIDEGNVISYFEAKNYLKNRIEGYGESDKKAVDDLNRKCIKKGYNKIEWLDVEKIYHGGKRRINNEKLYNQVFFKTRNNVCVAFIFVSH